MSRRPANILQADVARVVRAARQAGARSVEIKPPGGTVITIRLDDTPTQPESIGSWDDV